MKPSTWHGELVREGKTNRGPKKQGLDSRPTVAIRNSFPGTVTLSVPHVRPMGMGSVRALFLRALTLPIPIGHLSRSIHSAGALGRNALDPRAAYPQLIVQEHEIGAKPRRDSAEFMLQSQERPLGTRWPCEQPRRYSSPANAPHCAPRWPCRVRCRQAFHFRRGIHHRPHG